MSKWTAKMRPVFIDYFLFANVVTEGHPTSAEVLPQANLAKVLRLQINLFEK